MTASPNPPAGAIQALTKAQASTMRAIAALGGEANVFAGIRGVYSHSLPVLVRLGLLEYLGYCTCTGGEPCDRKHPPLPGQKGGERFVYRHRITPAGREWLAGQEG